MGQDLGEFGWTKCAVPVLNLACNTVDIQAGEILTVPILKT